MKLAGCKSAFNTPVPPTPSIPRVVYSTDRSKPEVLVLSLLFVALCSFVDPALLSVLFCFSICVAMQSLWLPASTAALFLFY